MTAKTLTFSLLLSVALACLASDLQSGPDQYAAPRQHDQSHPHRSLNEALKALKHRFDSSGKNIEKEEENMIDNNIVPELQVGCGDGLFLETTTTKPVIPKHKRVHLRKDRRKRDANERKPRGYYTYSIHTPASSISYTIWKPSPYKVQRPYFIPIFGVRDRFPLYFPPQSVYENPGFPWDNKPQVTDRTYLPPQVPTTEKIPNIGPRDGSIGGPIGGPVWSSYPANEIPQGTSPPVPTRRPSGPNTSTFPPLVHRPDPNLQSDKINDIFTSSEDLPTPQPFQRETTATPPRCAFAIINCCGSSAKEVNLACFESMGCPGPFWGAKPCDNDIARQAIDMALNYYPNQ